MRHQRAKKKEKEDNMNVTNLHDIVTTRRAATRERARKYRDKAKCQSNDQDDNESQSGRLAEIVSEGYSNSATLGKAVKKVSKALPVSPRKKKAILTHIVANSSETEKETLVNVVTKPKCTRASVGSHLNASIRKFYERDDISRVSPKTSDVKKYKCPETGEESLLPTRHMVLSLKEAYAVFVEETKTEEIGMITYNSF